MATPPPAISDSLFSMLWAFRSDVHRGRGKSDPTARRDFIAWWALHGRTEYPGLSGGALPADWSRWLSEASEEIPQDGFLPVSRIMVEVWRRRTDVQAVFDLMQPASRAGFIEWFLVYGLVEHPLADLLSDAQRRVMTTPGVGLATGLAPLTSLHMTLLKRDPALSERFHSTDPSHRAGFIEWLATQGGDRAFFTNAAPLRATPTVFAAPERPFGLNLIGFARGEFGIGEDVRMAALACERAGIPYSVLDVPVPDKTHRSNDSRLAGRLSSTLPYPVNLLCVTGFDTVGLRLARGRSLFEGRRTIGYWPWELPEWPDAWEPAFGLVDEIWSSTRFTQDAMAIKARLPVLHMPMAVDATMSRRYSRASFGLPEGRFLFLYTFDWNSFPARKNPGAAVAAFQAAFPDRSTPVSLILKTMGVPKDDPNWTSLADVIANDPRIGVINTVLDRDAVLGLCSVCDAVVSLHRSEGFGRTLAEAMLLGKPVIATAYSGNLDFCLPDTSVLVPARLVPVKEGEYPHAEGLLWADVDPAAAAEAMRRVVFDFAYRSRIADNGRRFMSSWSDPATVGRRYLQRLQTLARPVDRTWLESEPLRGSPTI